MLYELYVENLALIRSLRLPLREGMTALTGETGAGKSLIVDAVSLLIGSRGNDSLIRSGGERCLVEGLFLPPFPPGVLSLLAEWGVEGEDDLLLSRELLPGGRSVARLNGRPVALARLRELGRLLINIHGQHEYTTLLEDARQITLLDSFGGAPLQAAAEATAETWRLLSQARAEWAAYRQEQAQRQQRMAELSRVIEEISAAEIQPEEDSQLEAESRLLSHGEKLCEYSGDALKELRQAVDQLNDAYSALRPAASLEPEADALTERLHSAYYEAEDIAEELAAYQRRLDLNPYRLEQVESRLAQLGRLKKKYGGSLKAALARLERDEAELRRLEEVDLSGDSLRDQAEQAEAAYDAAAERLHACREQAAAQLSTAVTAELAAMLMPDALFRVDLPPQPASAHGKEGALFLIRPNIGEPEQPVSRIASGGELSRILLGIKAILAQLDAVPVLVFDEVDTGLSGRALVAVAERLAKVGASAQTLTVSHSAVMAAAADHHIYIEKEEDDGRTVTTAAELDHRGRVEELARLIAGDKAGDTTRRQAEDLLTQLGRQPAPAAKPAAKRRAKQ